MVTNIGQTLEILMQERFQFEMNNLFLKTYSIIWTASSEFGTYRLCEQRRFRRACASAQSRQNLRYSLIQAVSQEEPSDKKPDPWPLWMAGHAQLKFVMRECSKTQIRLTGLIKQVKSETSWYVMIVAVDVVRHCYEEKKRFTRMSSIDIIWIWNSKSAYKLFL